MRNTGLDDSSATPPVAPDKCSSSTGQTRNNKKHRTRSIANGRTGATSNVPSKENAGKRLARFGPLPLQEARVLQQLQTLSISSTSAAPANNAPSARQIIQFVPKRQPPVVKQPRLRRFKVDLTGNTDSEVDSPQSQPAVHRHHTPTALPKQLKALPAAAQSVFEIGDACSQADSVSAVCTTVPSLLENLSLGSESASATTPSRTALPALPDCITDTPDSMAMSTPACGQPLPSSGASPMVPMSCSTAGIQSANPLRNATAPVGGSPMCISPDTWATPQQLQWELSSDSLSAVQDSPQAPAKAPSPSASHLHIANLQFGLDAINDAAAAATAAGTCRRSRLASSSMADHLAGLSDSENSSKRDLDGCNGQMGCGERGSQGNNRGFDGLAEDTEWMEDLEVTPTPSQEASSTPGKDASSPDTELHLTLESDDEGSQQVLGFQVKVLHLTM